jgi:4-amino-4-deoxy-L-arabinose transferase-like glycosyltransferase
MMQSVFPKIELCRWDILAILLCSIPAFYLLGTPAIYIWDEAVYANASLDISHGHSWWVPVQELYNTKPPLVLWMQAFFLKIIPWPEWAIRLPSALSVTGLLFLLIMALRRWGFYQWTRILVLLCFVGNEGFIRHHISRTGDLDAVMVFFVTAYSLIALDAFHFKKWTNRHLFFFFISVVLAFYAKSIAGWIMLGPIGILWMLSSTRTTLLSKRFWLGSISSLTLCLLYYLIREIYQAGFLNLVWRSEYMRMFSNVMPWHEHGFGYYFKNFVTLHTYTPWIFFLAGAIFYALFILKEKPWKEHLVNWIIISLGYLLFISIPAVKLEWYDAPVYPFFAMILGVVGGHLTSRVTKQWILWFVPISFILWRKLNFIYHDTLPRHPFENEGSILRQVADPDSISVFMPVETPEHRLQLDFYRKLILEKEGVEVKVWDSISEVAPHAHIIISQAENLKKIQDAYPIDTIKNWPGVGYEIKIK